MDKQEKPSLEVVQGEGMGNHPSLAQRKEKYRQAQEEMRLARAGGPPVPGRPADRPAIKKDDEHDVMRNRRIEPRLEQVYAMLSQVADKPVSWEVGDAEHGILTISFAPPAAEGPPIEDVVE